MSVRGLANSSTKQYCITYHAKVQGREYTRSVTIREKYPPTEYRSFVVARNDFQQFARGQGSIVFVNVTGVAFGACPGSSGGGGGCTAPSSPVITASADEDSIFIDWADVSGATSYIVKRATVQGGPYTEIANNILVSQYDDTTAVVGTTYYYVVVAVNSCGTSGNSNEVSGQVLQRDFWLMADADTFSDAGGTTPSTNGGNVRCWKDQSGEGFDVTTALSPPPTWITNQLNGLPIVRWIADTNQSLTASAGTISQPITLLTVVKYTGNPAAGISGNFIVRTGGAFPQLSFGRRSDNSNVGIFSAFVNSSEFINAGVVANGAFAILTFVANGASSYIRVNGVQVATGDCSTYTTQGLFVCGPTSGLDLAELVRLQGSAPTQTFIDNIEDYLSLKWGIPI